ncbi:MAG TPA: HlyD family secretion protein [bacterium]|nr:HlyD family secretion protein [bacterium]
MAPPEKKKRKAIGVILLILLLVIIGGIIWYLDYRSTHIITDDAYIDGDIYTIGFQVPGMVREVLAHSNRLVQAGDVLARLDPKDIEAELAVARKNLAMVKNQVAGQRQAIEVVRSQSDALAAQKALLDKEKNRFSSLLHEQHVSVDEYDRVKTQWDAVNAQIAAAQNQRKQIEAVLGEPDAEGNEAAVQLAEAQVKRVELMLEHAAVTAPVAGYVTRKNVTVGQVVAAGQPIMSVVPLTGVHITANYKETDLTKVRSGQKVNFKVDTYPGVKFNGEVESIMAGTGAAFSLLPPENATGNYIKVVQRIPVRIKIVGADLAAHPLRVGMSVVPVILVEEAGK